MSLAAFREVLATIVLLVTVALLAVSLWAAYDRFKGSSEPADRSKHRCRHCSKEFQCRTKPTQTTLDANGSITSSKTDEPGTTTTVVRTQEAFVPTGAAKPAGALPVDQFGRTILRRRTTVAADDSVQENPQPAPANAAAAVRPRAGNVNSFQRRTVHVGSFPIEVSEPANRTCCAMYLSPEKPAERFCSYNCYRAMLKQIHPSAEK